MVEEAVKEFMVVVAVEVDVFWLRVNMVELAVESSSGVVESFPDGAFFSSIGSPIG